MKLDRQVGQVREARRFAADHVRIQSCFRGETRKHVLPSSFVPVPTRVPTWMPLNGRSKHVVVFFFMHIWWTEYFAMAHQPANPSNRRIAYVIYFLGWRHRHMTSLSSRCVLGCSTSSTSASLLVKDMPTRQNSHTRFGLEVFQATQARLLGF